MAGGDFKGADLGGAYEGLGLGKGLALCGLDHGCFNFRWFIFSLKGVLLVLLLL